VQPEMRINAPAAGHKWRVPAWLWPVLFWAGALYLLALPLVMPRGPFLWGRYRFLDLYLGLPSALAAVCATIVTCQPAAQRRLWTFRLTALWLAVTTLVVVLDLCFVLFVAGAWKADYWLDQAFISRRYSAADAELGFVRRPHIAWRGRLATGGQDPAGERYVAYRTDAQGFRNPPGLTEAAVVFIGDSFTEAAQVEEADTYVQRVSAATGLSTVNLGRGAYGPPQELIVLRRYGLAYQPRAVVWQLFEGNDLADAQNFVRWLQNPQAHPVSLKNRYLDNSLLRFLLDGTRQRESNPLQATLQLHGGKSLPLTFRYRYDPDQAGDFPNGLQATQTALREGQALCRARGIQLLVVYIPVMARVLEPWLQFNDPAVRTRVLADGELQQPSDTGSRLAAFCAAHGINFQDAFTALRERARVDNRGLYLPVDEHLDVQGHTVIAELVTNWLRAQQLLPMTESAEAARAQGSNQP
jgi:hypothetical protein